MAKKRSSNQSKIPTMHDVAKLAGVSQSTVSRVLNGSSSYVPISDETRERIMTAVDKLGYQPNMTAKSLRTQRTQMIAVMIGDISNAFYHPVVRAIQDVATAYDYDVLISNGDHVYENELRFLETVLRRPVDGVIMSPHRLTTEDLDTFVRRSRIPVVALGAQVHHPRIDVVGGTSEPATYEAISWLIKEKGHRRIGFIGVEDDMPPGPPRLRGYQRALEEASIDFDERLVQKVEFTIEGGRTAMERFLAQGELPTVLFACNSLMAIGAIQTAKRAGVRVPEELGVMGFDDIPEATIVEPKLTIVARDLSVVGKEVADILFERINGEYKGGSRFYQSKWQLVERESVVDRSE